MVATLQSRKDALESKLREKTSELKKLCIQEAELTGILPLETPIEPGESPPIFRRKVSTAFTYPENLIDKLKSKEEEAVAKLELECKIQMSIAEAALGLANDGNASKSIRRKHRLEYQRSQRRLAELEMRLNVLRQSIKSSSQYQRKKPRPPLNAKVDCTDGAAELASGELDSHFKHMHADEPMSLSFVNRDVIRNSHFYNSFGKSSHNYPSYVHHQAAGYQQSKSNNWNRNQLYRRSVGRTHHNSGSYDDNSNWLEDSSLWRNTAPVGYFSNQCYTTIPGDVNRAKARYGSLDRRHRTSSHSTASGSDFDGAYPTAAPPAPSRVSPALSVCAQQRASPCGYADTSRRGSQNCLLSPTDSALVNAVLLPNQTYPENSLMRTQSLGNVEQPAPRKSLDTHSLQEKLQENFQFSTLGRRTREKEWRETSLDADLYERQQVQLQLEQQQAQLQQQLQQQQAQLQQQQAQQLQQQQAQQLQQQQAQQLQQQQAQQLQQQQAQQLQQQQAQQLQQQQAQQQLQQQRHSQTPPLHPRAPAKVPITESPVPQRHFTRRNAQNTPPPLPPPHNATPASPPPITSKSPIKSPTLIESSVPFESPKNHTVVEVGKWQPYREVTKPFEMSDFYKYSTKFRKNTE